MIAPDVEITVDPQAWRELLLLLGGARDAAAATAPAGAPLVLFLDGGRPIRAIAVGRGPIPLDGIGPVGGLHALAGLRRRLRAPWLVALERGALGRALARWQRRAADERDFVAQSLALAEALGEEPGIVFLPGLRLPPYALVQRAFDLLLPDGRAAVLWIGGRRIVLEKAHGDLVRLASEAPRRPVHVEFRAEANALRRILFGPPGQLARELRAGAADFAREPWWARALIWLSALRARAGR